MIDSLFYNTVTPLLLKVLKHLMKAKEFESFRLVGGTSLSLQRGHRKSIDIDLFTDAEYGSVDFNSIDNFLLTHYKYVETSKTEIIGMGRSYFVGESKDDAIKLDVFYSNEPFIFPILEMDKLRLASVDEIIAMKIDIISRGGRKKDFWDIHELTEDHSLENMLDLHKTRHPYTHDPGHIKKQFVDFTMADKEADPDCLRGHFWELIKLRLIEFSRK